MCFGAAKIPASDRYYISAVQIPCIHKLNSKHLEAEQNERCRGTRAAGGMPTTTWFGAHQPFNENSTTVRSVTLNTKTNNIPRIFHMKSMTEW